MPYAKMSPEFADRILTRVLEVAKEIDPEDISGSTLENPIRHAPPPCPAKNIYYLEPYEDGTITLHVCPLYGEELLKRRPEVYEDYVKGCDWGSPEDEAQAVYDWASEKGNTIISAIAGAGIGAHRKNLTKLPRLFGTQVEFGSVDDLLLSLNAMAKDQSQKINLTEIPRTLTR